MVCARDPTERSASRSRTTHAFRSDPRAKCASSGSSTRRAAAASGWCSSSSRASRRMSRDAWRSWHPTRSVSRRRRPSLASAARRSESGWARSDLMTRARSLAALAMLAAAACGPKHVTSTPVHPTQALVVLLPDPETGVTGRAVVSNKAGSVDLGGPRESSDVSSDRRPADITVMSEADVKRVFGDALAALPPAPKHFTLYFRFESDELTDESRALLPDVLDTVRHRAVPEVVVVGHTDRMGAAKKNVELGLKRATTVRDLLVGVGLDRTLIEVTSHGEADPVVRTADETPE